jgi:hypothetical protein
MNDESPVIIALRIERLTAEIGELEKELQLKRAYRDRLQSALNLTWRR